MYKVVGVETVVAQIVRNYLKRREIFCIAKLLTQLGNSKAEGRFTKRIFGKTICNVTHRTYGKDNLLIF